MNENIAENVEAAAALTAAAPEDLADAQPDHIAELPGHVVATAPEDGSDVLGALATDDLEDDDDDDDQTTGEN